MGTSKRKQPNKSENPANSTASPSAKNNSTASASVNNHLAPSEINTEQLDATQLSAVINALDDIIHVVDKKLHVVLYNNACQHWLEQYHGHAKFLHKPLQEVFPFLSHKITQEYQHVFSSQHSLDTEESTTVNEQKYITRTRKIFLPDKGHGPKVLTVIRDITQQRQAEQQLRDSEANYRMLVENQTELVVKTDLEGHYQFVSPSYCELFGKTEKQLLGQKYVPVIHQDDIVAAQKTAKRLLKPPYTCYVEERVETNLGWRWLAWADRAIRDNKGNITAILRVGRDVTERRNAEQARQQAEEVLARSEQQYRTIFESTTDGLVVLDIDAAVVVDANPAACTMYGYDREELVGKNPRELFHPDDVPYFDANIARVRNNETIVTVARDRRKDGTYFDIEVIGCRIDYHGQPHILTVVRDITERKQAEEEVRLLSAAIQQSLQGIAVCELDGTIIFVNEAFAEQHGYKATALIGQNIAACYSLENWPAAEAAQGQMLHHGEFSGELWHNRRDGAAFPCLVRLSLLRDSFGRAIAAVGAFQDISELRQAQDQANEHQAQLAHAARLSTMGEMASGLAHEINQPLCAISTYASSCLRLLAAKDVDLKDVRTATQEIVTQAERAANIIRRMRSFARKQPPSRSAVNVRNVINDALGLLEPEVKKSQVKIKIKAIPNLPPVWVDAIQIEQVLINLLRNAIEAMQPTAPEDRKLSITIEVVDEHFLEVSVSDTGNMQLPDDPKKVFEAFFTTKPEGLGMGLSISSSIIQQHGGTMTVQANRPNGATFVFTLPRIPNI
ncbi:MAG: PAS domain S-box protein [Sedimentisphaerales bacterium]|nr:PAS domain S-box protein [Sedimentisphaerales bacterium]